MNLLKLRGAILLAFSVHLFVTSRPLWAMSCRELLQVNQLEGNTVAALVEKYHSFLDESNRRYELLRLESFTLDNQQLKKQIESRQRLFRDGEAYVDTLKTYISSRPPSERLIYLRGLTKDELIRNSAILDDLFGLQIKEMDEHLRDELESKDGLDRSKQRQKYGEEQIWYSPGGGQQSPWPRLIEVVNAMNLQPGQLVSDLGSGTGRLGLLIGLLRPDVNFVGLEIVSERVRYANKAAQALGFDKVVFRASNLSDPDLRLPHADHIYMFNPTNEKTSEIITEKLVQLSQNRRFRVYLLTYLQSRSFGSYFRRIESRPFSIYERSNP